MKHTSCALALTLTGFLLASAGWVGADDWPQWRGPKSDNHVTGFAEPKTWPKELTKKWKIEVGVGEASPVLVGDKVYTFGRLGTDEVTLCLDAATGKEVWKEKYGASFSPTGDKAYPGPRATPAVGDGKIVTLGVNGIVVCRDASTGKQAWKHDKGYPKFHTSSSPIIADGKCIVLAGNLTAYDLADGTSKWSTTSVKPGYGSPIVATIDGVKQVITPDADSLVGVNVTDGKILWKFPIGTVWQNSYSTPIIEGNMVYYSITPGKGGGGGANLVALKVEKKGDAFTAKDVWKESPAAGYHTPLLRDGLIYGVASKGRNFFCLDAKSGAKKWTDEGDHGECGSILSVGSVLVSLSSTQDLIVFRPTADKYSEVTRYKVGNSWCVPILAGNRIYVKDKAGSLTLWTLD